MKTILPENEKVISEIHGQLVKKDDRHYIPMYHPAAALYRNSLKEEMFADFAKIPEYMDKIS